ncbi:MAG: hypothetical protein ABI035_03460, partial [Gemmatimonadaceae bacterium]
PAHDNAALPVEPHPESSHRTPVEIAKDEHGALAPSPARAGPVALAPKSHTQREDELIRAAVQRSAHPQQTAAGRPAHPSRDQH